MPIVQHACPAAALRVVPGAPLPRVQPLSPLPPVALAAQARRLLIQAGVLLGLWVVALCLVACESAGPRSAASPAIRSTAPAAATAATAVAADHPRLSPADERFLDQVEERTFRWFWDYTNPENGLVPDRAPSPSFSSIAAVGFGLTAYPIGVERGWITRPQARARVLATLRFFLAAPQGPQPVEVTGYHGFYYHFLDMKTGHRFRDVELSSIDTALLMAGVLLDQSYFDAAAGSRDDPRGDEAAIRAAAEELYDRVDWQWMQARPPAEAQGWTPEEGFIEWDWRGYNEAAILFVLALGSPTHPLDLAAWHSYTETYSWGEHYGQTYLNFDALFAYQYSQMWVDFRGIRDEYMRAHDSDYFEISRRAALAQQAYAIANPGGFRDYGANLWGLTACDGPGDVTFEVDGRTREFHGYWARGTSPKLLRDDGTLSPTAAASAIAVAPELALPAMREMVRRYGNRVYTPHGFLDAFNPTFRTPPAPPGGQVRARPGYTPEGWFDVDSLGLDQGPIVGMIENYRSGLLWRLLRKNPHIIQGLRRAGFQGGWLDQAAP